MWSASGFGGGLPEAVLFAVLLQVLVSDDLAPAGMVPGRLRDDERSGPY